MSVREKPITALIGPSGCGKSTLLRCLNRMNDLIEDVRIEGAVRIDGEDIYGGKTGLTALRKKVGMVFQRPNPFPLSVFENIAFGPQVHHAAKKVELDGIVEESLRAVHLWDELKDRLDRSALGLSLEQKQRLCIARLVAVKSEVLLMDEPCSALDPIATVRIEELMSILRRDYTIVIVTHNMQQAARVSDETGFMLLGRARRVRPDAGHLHPAPGQADGRLHHRKIRLIQRTRRPFTILDASSRYFRYNRPLSGGKMITSHRVFSRLGAALLVAALAVAFGFGQAARGQQPPEYNEVVAASRIQDAAARLKEFERIKAAFPNAQMMQTIDSFISGAKVELAPTLDAVLDLQKKEVAAATGPRTLAVIYAAGFAILEHPKIKSFDPGRVRTVLDQYAAAMDKAAADPESFKDVPAEQQAPMKTYYVAGFGLAVSKAQLNAGDPAKALGVLEDYKKKGGPSDGQYFYALAEAQDASGRAKEAYESYLNAAMDNYEDSAARAKALYTKLNGKAEGFEAALAARMNALPYHPEPFTPPAGWKGKAVLAELFTGSECPPCVGADLGFDGLIESIPARYVTVLEYHLPIPRPDPMMNPATKKRQDVYGVNSTPTVVFDGTEKMIGGGNRGMAEAKFKQYREQVLARAAEAPGAALKLRASLSGAIVKVDFEIDKPVPGAEVNIVLVQSEQAYKGSNGLAVHKLVVRDLAVIDPAVTRTTTFDLAASEKAADAYLTEFEKTYTRVPNFKWSVRHNAIARQGLKVALFVQDKSTRNVLNSISTDVK